MLDQIVSSTGLDPTTPQGQALKKVFEMLALSTGVGAAARLAAAPLDRSPHQAPKPPKPLVVVVPKPQPVNKPISARKIASVEQAEKKIGKAFKKWAADNWLADTIRSIPFLPNLGIADFVDRNNIGRPTSFSGHEATNFTQVPWMYLGGAAAIPAGAYAGYRGVDKLLANRRKSRTQADIEAARNEYQNEILSKYNLNKQSSDQNAELAKAVNELYEQVVTKVAGQEEYSWLDAAFPGRLFGSHGATANLLLSGLVGGLGAYMGHNYARDENLGDIRLKKLQEAEEDELNEASPPIVAKFVDPAPQPKAKTLLGALGK